MCRRSRSTTRACRVELIWYPNSGGPSVARKRRKEILVWKGWTHTHINDTKQQSFIHGVWREGTVINPVRCGAGYIPDTEHDCLLFLILLMLSDEEQERDDVFFIFRGRDEISFLLSISKIRRNPTFLFGVSRVSVSTNKHTDSVPFPSFCFLFLSLSIFISLSLSFHHPNTIRERKRKREVGMERMSTQRNNRWVSIHGVVVWRIRVSIPFGARCAIDIPYRTERDWGRILLYRSRGVDDFCCCCCGCCCSISLPACIVCLATIWYMEDTFPSILFGLIQLRSTTSFCSYILLLRDRKEEKEREKELYHVECLSPSFSFSLSLSNKRRRTPICFGCLSCFCFYT